MLDLRPVTADDGAALHVLLSDPDVAAWLRPKGVTGPFSPEECETWVARDVAHWAAHGMGAWLAWDAETCAGRCALRYTLVEGRAEIEAGWAVTSRYWGRGVGTAMGRHALTAAAERGIINVVSFTRTDNQASRRVMEKLGLVYEREFEHAGYPHALYRTIREHNAP
jgi:RimJ/RimL family protein N-acetyltransferase